MKKVVLLFTVIIVFSFTQAFSADGEIEKRIYIANKISRNAPRIDGKLDDEIWQTVAGDSDFIQIEPNEGEKPSEQTVFKIVYDAKNLYVAIRARDRKIDEIISRVTRRDEAEQSDAVGVLIDSYFDHRTAFEFSVNAAGVKMDILHSDDGMNKDPSWDPVWFVATTIDDSGWSAEMKIPFSQLRFGKNSKHTWGLQVYRQLYRKQERSSWQFIPRKAPGFVHYFGELRGLDDISPPRRIELLPYTVANASRSKKQPGNPFATGQKNTISGGLDGKIGLTSDITADFTINPDFGQVEADPSIVNLTAFETFFEEKRPFFVEGKNIFDYRLMIGDGDQAQDMLFYSRRIGRSPHYRPDLRQDEHLDMPQSTSILSAFKISGKTANGVSIGVLDAVTAEEKASIERNGIYRHETVEPLTNYFVTRLQKDCNEGSTTIGGMLTGTNRKIDDPNLNFLNRAAYTGGFDLTHQWHNRDYFLQVKTAFSHLRGHKEAILKAQTASARYFQRPDAGHVQIDSSRTTLSGHGGFLGIGKIGGGHWQFFLGSYWRSPGLELNDIGFMRQADRASAFVWVGFRQYTPVWIFRSFFFNHSLFRAYNFGGEKLVAGGNFNSRLQFKNYWTLIAGLNFEGEALSVSELRGGPALKVPASQSLFMRIGSDERKDMQLIIGGFNKWNRDRISKVHGFFADFSLRPSKAISLSLNPFMRLATDNLQYVTTLQEKGEDKYILARIKQKTLALVLRLNYSLTPNLSIQYYGQPFVSAGSYSHFKKVTRPRAKNYYDRFHTFTADEITYDPEKERWEIDENRDGQVDFSLGNPNFNFRQFRSNLVVRWEYQPGSTLYLVWSQGRTGFTNNGRFDYFGDVEELFNVYPENVFLIKLNHWFSL